MTKKYEYKFVRLADDPATVSVAIKGSYHPIINKHAEEGWRLVQVLAPATGMLGSAHYLELIFEREL